MVRIRYLALVAFLSLFPCLVQAQSILNDWNALNDTRIVGDEIYLTYDRTNSVGLLQHKEGICAKEYVATFQINLGDNTAADGGAGISWFESDSSGALISQIQFDSFLDGSLDPFFETSGSHISLESTNGEIDLFGMPVSESYSPIFQIGTVEVPYQMEGAGWLDVSISNKEGFFTVTLSNNGNEIVFSGQGAYEADSPIIPFFYAYTGGAHNQHGVRNISIDVVQPGNCPAPVRLGFDQALAEIEGSCGTLNSCPADIDGYRSCFNDELLILSSSNLLVNGLEEQLSQAFEEQLSYCSGYDQCLIDVDPDAIRDAAYQDGYDKGFEAGVDSIDQQAIWRSGFDAGVASIDIEAIKKQAYQEGFAAGQQAVCPPGWIKNSLGECKQKGSKKKGS